MSFGEIVAIAFAGLAAGTINTVVGSGTLITFPVLLAFGYAPVTANVSNTIGLVPGSISGAIGYRRELSGQRSRAIRLGTMSVLGGITGAVLLLVLPASAFKAIVPVFIALALVLVVPPLVSLIPGTIANHVHGYLPNVAGQLVAQSSQQAGDVLSPWQGFGVFCIWTAVLLAACGWLLVRRDA